MKFFRRYCLWARLLSQAACLFVIVLLGGAAAPGEPPGKVTRAFAIKQLVFSKGLDKAALASLTTEERELLVWYLRSLDDAFELAMMGDREARAKEVAKFLENPRWGNPQAGLNALRDPQVIPMIGEALFKEETEFFPERGHVILSPTQAVVRYVVVHTLRNSAEFNEAVINWARRLHDDGNLRPEETVVIRQWYRANEEKLKAGDFKAVQPGGEPERPLPPAAANAELLAAGAVRPPRSGPSLALAVPRENKINYDAWIAGALLVTFGGVLFVVFRRRSSRGN